ncbi:MAG: hypothetical protein ACREA4_08545, partial [Nitrososphaera sp.]
IIAVTAITIAAGALILSTSYLGNGTAQSISSILGLDRNSGSVGIAEAAILPLDVDENFRVLEKTGDGKTKATSFVIDTDHVDPDEHCEFCMRIEFNPGNTGKGGIVLKGDRAFDLDKATRIAFFARGETGGEDVQFMAAGKENLGGGAGPGQLKFSFVSETTKLQKDWHKVEMDLTGKDLKAITHAFAVDLGKSELKNSKEPIVIYLKGITFDEVVPKKSLRAAAS